ncbi:MAG TPA: thioredoxin family protein [Pyrinomonadaceae bacterium]
MLLLSFFTASLSFTLQRTSAAPQLEDRWLRDAPGYERASQLQRELGVPMVVYFYTDWCPFCHALDSRYLPTPPVQQYLRGVVKVRINPEHGPAERALAEQYAVTGYPSFLVIRKPSSLPVNVNPFKRDEANLTAAQFARACERGVPSWGLVSTVRVTIKPVPLSATVAPGRVTPAPVPSTTNTNEIVTSILNKYVQAVGGRETVSRLTSRFAKGRLDLGTGSSGTFETYSKSPNMSLKVMKGESIGVLKRGFDGHTAWSFSDKKGAPQPSAKELAASADDENLYRDIKLQEFYPRMNMLGRGTVGNREVFIVEATSRLGTTDKLYFDVENGLLLRRDTTRSSAHGPVQAEIYFSDWRDVDGIKLPFKTTERTPDSTYVFTLEDVRHNVQLDDEVFRIPSR